MASNIKGGMQAKGIEKRILLQKFNPRVMRMGNGECTSIRNLCPSSKIVRVTKSKRLRWAGHVPRMEDGRSTLKISEQVNLQERHLERPGRRWERNFRMDLKGIGIKTRNWIDSAQDREY